MRERDRQTGRQTDRQTDSVRQQMQPALAYYSKQEEERCGEEGDEKQRKEHVNFPLLNDLH